MVLKALAGLALGVAAAIGLAVVAAYAFDISQAEGAYAMQVAFLFVPAGAILGLVGGIIWGRRSR